MERGSTRRPTLKSWERAIINQTNIGTVSKATLRKLLRDGVECVWWYGLFWVQRYHLKLNWERQWTKHGYWKLGTCHKSQCNAAQRGRYFIDYFATHGALCYRNHARQQRASLRSTCYYRDCAKKTEQILQKPQACVKSNFFTITHLCLCQNWCKNISPRKTLKLGYNLPAAWILHHLMHKANNKWSTEHITSCKTKCTKLTTHCQHITSSKTKCMKLTTDGQQNT